MSSQIEFLYVCMYVIQIHSLSHDSYNNININKQKDLLLAMIDCLRGSPKIINKNTNFCCYCYSQNM